MSADPWKILGNEDVSAISVEMCSNNDVLPPCRCPL